MDMATLLQMFQSQGGQPTLQAGMQPQAAAPTPQLAQMLGAQGGMQPAAPGGSQTPGFGLGQQLMQPGQLGQTPMAGSPQPGDGGMGAVLGGQGGDPNQMANLLKIAQLLQARQGQQGGMAPMMMGNMMQHQGQGAQPRDMRPNRYMAQGGGATSPQGF